MRTATGAKRCPESPARGDLAKLISLFLDASPCRSAHFSIPHLWFMSIMSPVRFMGDIDDMVDMVDMGYDSPPDAHPSGW